MENMYVLLDSSESLEKAFKQVQEFIKNISNKYINLVLILVSSVFIVNNIWSYENTGFSIYCVSGLLVIMTLLSGYLIGKIQFEKFSTVSCIFFIVFLIFVIKFI